MTSHNLTISPGDGPFSLISDDCFGGFIYQRLNLEYNTPFMWLYLRDDEYIKLLKNLKYYLSLDLKFIKEEGVYHPLGILDDVRIYFNHYKTEYDAKSKWEKRVERFNWDNIVVKFASIDEELLHEFDNLPYANKLAITPEDYNLKCANCILNQWSNEYNKSRFIHNFKLYAQDATLNSLEFFNWHYWITGN